MLNTVGWNVCVCISYRKRQFNVQLFRLSGSKWMAKSTSHSICCRYSLCIGEYIYSVFVLSSHQEGILRAFEWKGWHLKAFPAHIVFMLYTGRITIIPMQWKALGRLLKPLGLLPSNHLLGQNAGNKEVRTSVSWVQVSSACSASFVELFTKMFRKKHHIIHMTACYKPHMKSFFTN